MRCKRKNAPSELENRDFDILTGSTNQVAPIKKNVKFIKTNITICTIVRRIRSLVKLVFGFLCHAIDVTYGVGTPAVAFGFLCHAIDITYGVGTPAVAL
jgi:hypothetical protein